MSCSLSFKDTDSNKYHVLLISEIVRCQISIGGNNLGRDFAKVAFLTVMVVCVISFILVGSSVFLMYKFNLAAMVVLLLNIGGVIFGVTVIAGEF